MATGKFIAYYRVSTQQQGHSGLGLEAQKAAVENYLNGGKWTVLGEYTEVESGRKSDRPELAKAIAFSKRARATLVIAKLDRLARNVAFISTLMESGVQFIAVDMPQANKFTLHIMAAMAEHEAEAISTRTREALKAARARGAKLGGRRVSAERFQEIAVEGRKAAAETNRKGRMAFEADMQPIFEEIRAEGKTTLKSIAEELNRRGERTRRGCAWTPVQVQRLRRALAVSDIRRALASSDVVVA